MQPNSKWQSDYVNQLAQGQWNIMLSVTTCQTNSNSTRPNVTAGDK